MLSRSLLVRIRRVQSREILGIEGLQRSFDGGPDSDDSIFDARPKKGNPELATER